MKQTVVLYIHGKGGDAGEAAHYGPLFPDCDVKGLDYRGQTPWEAGAEIKEAVGALKKEYDEVLLIANSIGAFFAMCAGIGEDVSRAWLISPVVDMERLITDRMRETGVPEADLRQKGTVCVGAGETLSWDWLQYVRNHPIAWQVPTELLYGSGDALTARETVTAFAAEHGARLTVMEGGEHWFHTPAQMSFLDGWICRTRQECPII